MIARGNEYWTTKEGKKLRIQDIDDGHLVNILQYLRRRCNKVRAYVLSKFLEEMGMSRNTLGAVAHVRQHDWRKFLGYNNRVRLRNLEREAVERGLEWEQ